MNQQNVCFHTCDCLYSSVPFIFLPLKNNVQMVIDTGATKCFINHKTVKEQFDEELAFELEDFVVITPHGESKHNQKLNVRLNCFENIFHSFYVFDISTEFAGVIGIDLLRRLNAKIDLANEVLITDKGNQRIKI